MNFFVIIACFVLLTSCGKDSQNFSENFYGNPILLESEEGPCLESTSQLGKHSFFEYKNFNLAKKNENFSYLNSKESLKGKFLNSSSYNLELKISNTHWSTKNKGSNLQLCQKNGNYSKESIESASLSTISALNQTYDFYSSLKKKNKLEKINLIQQALLYQNVKLGEYRLITDNAFYFSLSKKAAKILKLKKGPYIGIAPQSVEYLENSIFGGYPLWQISFVASHEYGHHIFSSNFPKAKRIAESFRWQNKMIKNQDHYLLKNSPALFNPNRNKPGSLERALLGLNEAVADLFAYYSKNKLPSNFSCLAHRDLDSPKLGIVSKILDDWFLEQYFHKSKSLQKYCNEPSLQDEHSLGAVIAFGVKNALEAGFNDNKARAQILIQWLHLLNNNFSEKGNKLGDNYLKTSISDLSKVVIKNTTGSKKTKVCGQFQYYFPAVNFPDC